MDMPIRPSSNRDLNSGPSVYKTDALPLSHWSDEIVVTDSTRTSNLVSHDRTNRA